MAAGAEERAQNLAKAVQTAAPGPGSPISHAYMDLLKRGARVTPLVRSDYAQEDQSEEN